MSPTSRPSAIIIVITALLTTMLLNRVLALMALTPMDQQFGEAMPSAMRIILFVLYWGFWFTRFFRAKHTTVYLVYLALMSDILLYLVGLDVIRQEQVVQVQPWLVIALQIVGAVVAFGTVIFIKKFYRMGWLIVASLFSSCFILGGFITLLLDHNIFRSLVWLIAVEISLIIYFAYIFCFQRPNN